MQIGFEVRQPEIHCSLHDVCSKPTIVPVIKFLLLQIILEQKKLFIHLDPDCSPQSRNVRGLGVTLNNLGIA